MCHVSCIVYGAKTLSKDDINGKDVLEVGSYDVNGTLRPILESWGPRTYIGVDITEGPGVDVVCYAERLVEHFGNQKFDVVVTTEMLEHVRDWQSVISNLKNITKPGGLLVVTTRSYGMKYHAHPYDFWRYEKEDMEEIFSDFELLDIEKDTMSPGIFLKARRPADFREKQLGSYELYSMITNSRISRVTDADFRNPHFQMVRLLQVGHRLIAGVKRAGRTVEKALKRGPIPAKRAT